jgi:phage shock protein B
MAAKPPRKRADPMHGPEILIPILVVGILFIGLPWLVFHYVTKWKTAKTITTQDEDLLDELYDLARRLDDRMNTIERIVQADNPNWRSIGRDPVESVLEDRADRGAELSRSNRPARRN